MKKYIVGIIAVLFLLAGCATTQQLQSLEEKVTKLERKVIISGAEGAGKNFYPATALTGGGSGALDKVTTPVAGDVAFVVLNNDAAYGYATLIYVAHDFGGAATEAVPYIVVPNTDPGNMGWVLTSVYGGELYGNIKYITTDVDCTIGSTCDGTSVRVARGGIIEVTVDAKIVTLPEIVASAPTAIQVTPGASLCAYNKDANEHFHLNPHDNDYLTIAGVLQDAAGKDVSTTASATSIGDYICVVATSDTNWTVFGYKGTLVAE